MATHIELNPATHLTVNTIGEPGNRTFYLQGGREDDVVSLVIEKQQAAALAEGFESLLEELAKEYPDIKALVNSEVIYTDLTLRQPIDSLFRVGNLSLGFSEGERRVVVVAYELVPEDEEPNVVSFWSDPEHIKSLIEHTKQVVQSGRPVCAHCGEPIEPTEAHWCIQQNGHKH